MCYSSGLAHTWKQQSASWAVSNRIPPGRAPATASSFNLCSSEFALVSLQNVHRGGWKEPGMVACMCLQSQHLGDGGRQTMSSRLVDWTQWWPVSKRKPWNFDHWRKWLTKGDAILGTEKVGKIMSSMMLCLSISHPKIMRPSSHRGRLMKLNQKCSSL